MMQSGAVTLEEAYRPYPCPKRCQMSAPMLNLTYGIHVLCSQFEVLFPSGTNCAYETDFRLKKQRRILTEDSLYRTSTSTSYLA
jgi:hypothetical protein